MEKPTIQIVWFKRDLRLQDHAPLAAAIATGLPTLLWYTFEPSVMAQPTFEVRHGRFIWESLQDMQRHLSSYRGNVLISHGECIPQLDQLADAYRIVGIYGHQETGPKVTYDRDEAVRAWCKSRQVPLHVYGQDGVVRGITNRDDWERAWYRYMQAPVTKVALEKLVFCVPDPTLTARLSVASIPPSFQQAAKNFQPGGSSYAWKYLSSFIQVRSKDYVKHLSSPSLSRTSCSRLSPYLAYGCVSAREVYQLSQQGRKDRAWGKMFAHFQERLWWRSHYMQKLETEWQIEFEPINRGMAALKRPLDEQKLAAFAAGKTGFPLVDASIRCLQANGFLNFRMRAMLATFASFALELPWQATAEVLARLFLDYEPGIHYAQIQMQAGMSGYHPLRIFHPTIQAEKHDPQGLFMYQYLPELAQVPTPEVFTPWNVPVLAQQLYQCVIGRDYPEPIVAYEPAVEAAKARYWEVRQRPETQRHLSRLWRLHCLPRNRAEYEAEMKGWNR